MELYKDAQNCRYNKIKGKVLTFEWYFPYLYNILKYLNRNHGKCVTFAHFKSCRNMINVLKQGFFAVISSKKACDITKIKHVT